MRSLSRGRCWLGSALFVCLLAACSQVDRTDLLPAPDRPIDPAALADLSKDHAAIEPLAVTADGHPIPAYYAAADHPRGVVILIGGTGNDAEALLRATLPETRRLNLDFVTFSYYLDEKTPPDLAEIRAASRAVYDAVATRAAPAKEPIYLLGQGVGSWFALNLAEQVPARALILASVGTTVAETFGQHYLPMSIHSPVNIFVRYGDDEDLAELDAMKEARGLTLPTLIVTSDADDEIAPALTKRVYSAMPYDTVKQFVLLDNVEHDGYLASDRFWDAVAVFLKRH